MERDQARRESVRSRSPEPGASRSWFAPGVDIEHRKRERMKLVGQVSRPRRRVREKTAEYLGAPATGPHINRPVLPAAPHWVGPNVDRLAPQLDFLLATGVAVHRISGRFTRVDFEQPRPLARAAACAAASSFATGACPGTANRTISSQASRIAFIGTPGRSMGSSRLQITSYDYKYRRWGGLVNEIPSMFESGFRLVSGIFPRLSVPHQRRFRTRSCIPFGAFAPPGTRGTGRLCHSRPLRGGHALRKCKTELVFRVFSAFSGLERIGARWKEN